MDKLARLLVDRAIAELASEVVWIDWLFLLLACLAGLLLLLFFDECFGLGPHLLDLLRLSGSGLLITN